MREGCPQWVLVFFAILTAPLGLRGERRLADLLREGRDDEVVEAVRLG